MKVIIILCLSAVLTVNGQSANLNCDVTSPLFADPVFSPTSPGCPASNTMAQNVTFFLSNQANPEPSQIYYNQTTNLTLYNSNPTVFLVHGYLQSCSDSWLIYLGQQWIVNANVNIICVNWTCLTHNYPIAATINIGTVGIYIAQLIGDLQAKNYLTINTTTLFGHSLGSHVVGIAGERVFNDTGSYIDRIFASDPAGPCITTPFVNPTNFRLDATDATYVEVYHCSVGTTGTHINCGDADVYFNKGTNIQCGCSAEISDVTTEEDAIIQCRPVCSHENCNLYFMYSLIKNNIFTALQIPPTEINYLEYKNISSENCPSNINQFYSNFQSATSMNIGIYGPRLNGIFTCPTTLEPPHCAQTNDPNICSSTATNYFNKGSVCSL